MHDTGKVKINMKKLILILVLLLLSPTVKADNMNYIDLALTDTTGILEYKDPLQSKLVDCNFTFKGSYNTITLKSPAYDTLKSVKELSATVYPDNGYMSIIIYTRDGKHEGTKLTVVNGEESRSAYVIKGYLYLKVPINMGENKLTVIAREGNIIVTLVNWFKITIGGKDEN